MPTRKQKYGTITYQFKGIKANFHIKKTDLKNVDLDKSYVGLSVIKKGLLQQPAQVV